jgi:(4-(4-[2-(gamma-L-glutamylamino)ethyl]phenoxymethyl)furan-2-yl)methanamine synthase
VKAATTDGRAVTRPFPIWREPERLADVLREVIAEFATAGRAIDLFAVTTTAELADCFRTKAAGVDHVLGAVESIAEGRPVAVWQTGAEFVAPAVAREIPLLVAAANWHALATWLGRLAPSGRGLIVDVGSTTTDLVPLLDGVPVPNGMTDVERLLGGELVYTGVRRTPVFHTSRLVPFRGTTCALVPEQFATMLDVYLLRGDLREDPDDLDTANGRPATVEESRDRLARAICCDRTEADDAEIDAIAEFLAESQQRRLATAIDRIARGAGAFERVLVSGSGAFLAERAIGDVPSLRSTPRTRLAEVFDSATATAACARAVAELAVERRADRQSDA